MLTLLLFFALVLPRMAAAQMSIHRQFWGELLDPTSTAVIPIPDFLWPRHTPWSVREPSPNPVAPASFLLSEACLRRRGDAGTAHTHKTHKRRVRLSHSDTLLHACTCILLFFLSTVFFHHRLLLTVPPVNLSFFLIPPRIVQDSLCGVMFLFSSVFWQVCLHLPWL